MNNKLYQKYIKRGLDIISSLGGLIILSPVMLTTALLVRENLGSPVIFKQIRPGKDNELFVMYKFRTMTDAVDSQGNKLSDEDRLTPFGKKLRATSLDELPELFNILKGDMSLVGPRPLLPEYLDLYTPRQMKRHLVRPGLTGLAQVNGRNNISWDRKFEYDYEYVKSHNFLLDCKIILKTIVQVFQQKDINKEGYTTVQPFRGSIDYEK